MAAPSPNFLPPPDEPPFISRIMLGIVIWGTLLGLGASIFGGKRAALQGLIIFLFPLLFLGGWALLLRQRSRRLERQAERNQRPQ